MTTAIEKLKAAQARTGSLLSVGLEPCAEYLPASMTADLGNYESFLRDIIEASAEHVCAFKFNLAHFEALGWEGMELLYCVRDMIPDNVLVIADAKRGDIGSTAKQYAEAIFGKLKADAVTLNPLMGRDSAAPFLEWKDKLNIFLVLTSNPGAADFLLPNDLYKSIAHAVKGWNEHAGNCAFVTGATRPAQLGELRAIAPSIPFLVPGLGAQGGDLAETIRHGRITGDFSGLILHVTRGILPGPTETGDPVELIRAKVQQWNRDIEKARSAR
ncbi:orotidine-5'-phosphate decarboxylase [bacterium]|nr:orotidine-5'-phosphate decarboxylase [bacterium]